MSSSPPSPPFFSRFWLTLLLVLAAFGISATTVAVFFTNHPLLALAIGLLYEVTLFVLGFLGKVWQRLEGSYVERTATWFDHWAQDILSRYRKQYYDYLRYQHRDFDMKGLSTLGTYTLELDQIFVELSIHPTTPQQAASNPIQIPQVLLKGSHSIWDYLTSTPLIKQHLVIIGPPGSGKTTLLKHITLTLVSHYQPHQTRKPHKLPILLFLRDHAQAIKEQPDFSLVDAVHGHLKKWEQRTPPIGWVKRQLTSKRCLIMLDGLDEVADPEARQKVVNWVEQQMAAYGQNRFIVTSRPFGYRSNPLRGVTILEVRPFTVEQVERFIQKWYLANEIMSKQKSDPGIYMRARAEAKALLQQLRNTPTLFALTVNPLLLTMITTVHRYGGELPGNRIALYAEICEVFLGKRQKARGQTLALTPAQMQLVLEPLAYYLMIKGARDITLDEVRTLVKEPLAYVSSQMSTEEFLQLVENASGLLLERENGVYSFAHLTFQEYLAATYIREKQLVHTLIERISMSWWQETIRLYCAMANATPIIAACLVGYRPSVAVVGLAIDCDKEAREVQPETRAKLETFLRQGVEDFDFERRHLIVEALLTRRLRQMVQLNDKIYADTSLITCVEYQIFLDEQRARSQYFQPDHWTSHHFLFGQGNSPILGVRPSDAISFCAWLTEREPSPWFYRLPEAGELENEGIHDKLPADTGYWLKDGKGFVWTKEALIVPNNIAQELVNQIQLYVAGRAKTVIRGHALILNLAFKRNLHFDLDPTYELTRELSRTPNIGLAQSTLHQRFLAFVHDLVHNRVQFLVHRRFLALTLAHDLVHLSAYTRIHLDRFLNRAHSHISTLDSSCIDILDLVFVYCWENFSSRKGIRSTLGLARKREIAEIEYLDSLLTIYMDLIILKKRVKSELPICEGILIMKERKTPYANG